MEDSDDDAESAEKLPARQIHEKRLRLVQEVIHVGEQGAKSDAEQAKAIEARWQYVLRVQNRWDCKQEPLISVHTWCCLCACIRPFVNVAICFAIYL